MKLGAETQLRIDRFVVKAAGIWCWTVAVCCMTTTRAMVRPTSRAHPVFGLVAVRGTRFFAGPSNGVFGVFVELGEVTVVGVNTAVVVTSQFGTDIARPGDEPTPPHLWGAARIAAAMASVNYIRCTEVLTG